MIQVDLDVRDSRHWLALMHFLSFLQ